MVIVQKQSMLTNRATTIITFSSEEIVKILISAAQEIAKRTDQPCDILIDAGCCSLGNVDVKWVDENTTLLTEV